MMVTIHDGSLLLMVHDGYVGKAGGIVVTMIGNSVGKDGF